MFGQWFGTSFTGKWWGAVGAIQGIASGGWEYYLRHESRQRRLRKEEEERLEQIAAQRLAIEQAQAKLQATKAEQASKDANRDHAIARLTRSIAAQERELAVLMDRLDSLLVLTYLENERFIEQKRRNAAAMILLLEYA